MEKLPAIDANLRCSCGQVTQTAASADQFTCRACQQSWRFVQHPACRSTAMLLTTRITYPCPWCEERVDIRFGNQLLVNFVSAGDHGAQLRARGVDRGRGDQVITGLTIVGGYGWVPQAGTRISLAVCPDHLAIATVPLDRPAPVLIPFADLVAFDFQGGVWKKGQAVIGGGFGITGALTGVVVASVLNRLMTSSGINTVVRISATNGELYAHHGALLPNDLRTMLAPAVNSVTTRREGRTADASALASAPAPAATADRADRADGLLAQLERLAALRANGVLTDEEFQLAKRRILNETPGPH